MMRRDFLKTSLAAGAVYVGNLAYGAKGDFGSQNAAAVPLVTLNNGVKMPILGYGTLKLPSETCGQCVAAAIERGWRLIDTAKNYANEQYVGEGIRSSGIDRKELFVTSKLWLTDAGYEKTKVAFQKTLDRLQLDYLDLYLIHQPFGDVYGAWRAMTELYKAGQVRAIGVSNFFPDRLVDFIFGNEVKLAVNQIEVNPYNQQHEAEKVNREYGVQVEAWSPLAQAMRPEMLVHPILQEIGKAHGKTPVQVILRWLTQRGIVTLVKTQHEARMIENISIFDFTLSADEMRRMATMDTGKTFSKDHRNPLDVKWFHTEATRK